LTAQVEKNAMKLEEKKRIWPECESPGAKSRRSQQSVAKKNPAKTHRPAQDPVWVNARETQGSPGEPERKELEKGIGFAGSISQSGKARFLYSPPEIRGRHLSSAESTERKEKGRGRGNEKKVISGAAVPDLLNLERIEENSKGRKNRDCKA